MAGITKSPQLRLSPETANVQEEADACAAATEATPEPIIKAASANRATGRRSFNMQTA
jgi:hypothetical protein